MRTTLVVLTLLACSSVIAQETNDVIPVYPKHEIGLSGETNFGNSDYGGPSMLQYKHWMRHNMAIRVNAGIGTYQAYNSDGYYGVSGDTILERQTHNKATMGYGGFGIEMHRHFYKSIHLYAAAEVMAGYGSGTSESFLVKRVITNGQDYSNSDIVPGNSGTVSLFNLNIAPYVGAKIVLKRISFGTELSGISMGYTNVSTNGKSSSSADMNAGSFRQRFYVLFRF